VPANGSGIAAAGWPAAFVVTTRFTAEMLIVQVA